MPRSQAGVLPGHEPPVHLAVPTSPLTLANGVSAQALFGEGAMLSLVELEPDALVPLHSHPHEQLGVVLRGERT